jgi:hypothetical protein
MQRRAGPAVVLAAIAGLAVIVWLPPGPAAAQADERCFPETGFCIAGRFRHEWEQSGGVEVYGFPITPARQEFNRDTGQMRLTQWFERNRFELHPEYPAPSDVLLGRLGDDRLRQKGVDWSTLPPAAGPQEGCRYFPETRRNVCNQSAARGFLSYWTADGLKSANLDPLALFGLPLTEAALETNPSGATVLTQWFERARFEWHPDKPDEYKVLLGLLGRETLAATPPATPDPPAGTPPPPAAGTAGAARGVATGHQGRSGRATPTSSPKQLARTGADRPGVAAALAGLRHAAYDTLTDR